MRMAAEPADHLAHAVGLPARLGIAFAVGAVDGGDRRIGHPDRLAHPHQMVLAFALTH